MHRDYIKSNTENNNQHTKAEADYDNDSETDDDLPDLKGCNSSEDEQEHGEEEYSAGSSDQKADIGPMFKIIKMEVAKRNANKENSQSLNYCNLALCISKIRC